MLVVGVFVVGAAMQPAQAYIDPNSAGPLYQLLFPLLVAITSGITAFRSAIARIWRRLFSERSGEMSTPRNRSDTEPGS
jgi:hypothetical protein